MRTFFRWLRHITGKPGDREQMAGSEPENAPIVFGVEAGSSETPAPAMPQVATLNLIDPARPVFIEINQNQEGYSGRIHQGTPEQAFPLPHLALGRTVQPVKDRDWTLDELLGAIIAYKADDIRAFDERVQLDVGRYLYAQTLGRLPQVWQQQLTRQTALELRILTRDEWIVRLPWNLLTDQHIFRCATGWSVAVCSRSGFMAYTSGQETSGNRPLVCHLPPSPRLLIVAPQPVGVAATHAGEHLEDLENLLSSHDPRLCSGNHLRIASTWEQFIQLAQDFKPQLVYYYGHGIGDRQKTRLVFATGAALTRVDKPVADFALCLRRLETPPFLVYMNCCLGDAGGFLGVGMQLGDFIPAVITNRTVAEIDVARAQAITLWKQILVYAVPPHQAVAAMYANLDLQQLTLADIRWITPVLHAHYTQWQATRSTPPDRLSDDPHWHLKIDRVSQYNSVIAQTRLMLREQKPKSLVFVWYGEEGQGIEIFHKRLLVELREELTNAFVYQRRPRWPEHLEDYHTAFSDVLTETFGVNTLEDIPARVRAESQGRPTLIYVRHEPVRSTQLINPQSLKEYVLWWDTEFVPKLERKQFALLTVSFLVVNPPAFAEYVEDEHIEELDLKQTVFWLLDEMEKLAKKHLLLFLRTHNIELPRDRKDKVLQKILTQTGGRYEQTVEALKQLRQEAWRVVEHAEKSTAKTGRKDFRY